MADGLEGREIETVCLKRLEHASEGFATDMK